MLHWRQVARGLRTLVRRGTADRDVADEVQHYLDEAAAAHVARGLDQESARRAATLEVGSATALAERVRSYGWEHTVATLATDVRYALRMLRKSPAFTIVGILIIALGTGAVTTIFSGMNAIVLRPLPGTANSGQLIGIDRRTPGYAEGMSASYEYFDYLRTHARSLESVAAWSKATFSVAVGGEGIAVYGNVVSGTYFATLGVRPALGRFFLPDEDRTPLTHPVMVVSHAFWQVHLGADSAAVGRQLNVNGHPYTIVGVAPPEFHGVFTPLLVDAWVPLMMQPQLRPGRNLEHVPWLWTFGRLADGASRAAARSELELLTARYIEQRTEPATRARFTAIRLTDMDGLPADAHAMALGFIGLLFGAATLVLLIASVNVASMLSARALVRRREMAVRAALGASRTRLVRQVLTEILVLFAAGGACGMLLAWQASIALERIDIPSDVPMVLELSPDLRVFGFALLVSLASGVLFGLVPALRTSHTDINARLRDGSASVVTQRLALSRVLVTGQLALSLVLVVAAGLFLKALNVGANMNPGFDSTGVSTLVLNSEAWGYDSLKGREFYRNLRDRVAAIPGVDAVSFTSVLPLTFSSSSARIDLEGQSPTAPNGEPSGETVDLAFVAPDFFRTLGVPLLSGRAIATGDDEAAMPVAVVNATLARRFWPDGSALGRTFRYGGKRVTIAGVVRDAKYSSLSEVTPAFAYFPISQWWQPNQVMLVRSTSGHESLAGAIQRAVAAIDPALPRPVVTPLREANGIVLLPQRIAALVTGALGAVGLLLATVGLYGTVAYGVNRRTREIGLRVALGATRRDVLALVLRGGLRLAGWGVAIGLVLAGFATRLMRGLLFDVSPLDAATFVGMSLLFVAVALLASYLPARRASAADPMSALRVD